jgi:tRNA(Ile)-lysidine synthase
MCKDLNIPLIEGQASNITLNRPASGSQEDLGRQLRRHFFEKVAQKHNAQYIALAHHADDQTETFLIRIIRGATLAGLTGIKKQNGLYWRPLLKLSKQEIVRWLDDKNVEYLTDPTNASPDFLRNRIRNTVIPALKDSDSRFDANFARTLENLQETEQFMLDVTQDGFNAVVDHDLSLDIHKLSKQPSFLQKRIIVDWLYKNKVQATVSNKLVQEVMRFLNHERGGLHQVHTTWGIEKKQHKASIKQL